MGINEGGTIKVWRIGMDEKDSEVGNLYKRGTLGSKGWSDNNMELILEKDHNSNEDIICCRYLWKIPEIHSEQVQSKWLSETVVQNDIPGLDYSWSRRKVYQRHRTSGTHRYISKGIWWSFRWIKWIICWIYWEWI